MSSTVVGTSVGALNAARVDPTPVSPSAAVIERLGDLAARLEHPSAGFDDRLIEPARQILGRAIGRLVPAGKHAPDYDVASPPYHPGVRVVSCRRSDGTRRITQLSTAQDYAAELYASAAIPGWAPPVLLGGVEHVDGAMWSTSNADLISPDDHDLLIAIVPMVSKAGGSLVVRGHRASLLDELDPWHEAGKPVVYVVPTAEALSARKDHHAFAADARKQISD